MILTTWLGSKFNDTSFERSVTLQKEEHDEKMEYGRGKLQHQ